MAYLRHAARHVHQTVYDRVEGVLINLGWIGLDPPFGARSVTYQNIRPNEEELKSLTANTVSVSFGNEPDDVEDEMGGGLLTVEFPFFVDVYAEKEAIALAIASDVKDNLAGRVPGTSRFLTVVDQRTTTPVLGYQLEFTDLVREPVERELVRLFWQVVRCTATLTYVGEGS